MNIEALLFYIFSSIAIVSGIMVISSRNPMHSVLFLVLVFCNAAGLLLLLETEFLAMLLLIVYVGAIAVLFLFVVMMLNIRLTELNESILRYLPIGGVILLIFLFELLSVINGDLIPFFSSNLFMFENENLILNQDSNRKINKITPPIGRYRRILSFNSVSRIFNIITTNKNNTAIAPTYTINNNIAKNSVSSKSNNPAALQKTNTKNKTECIGFLELITIIPETIAILENI
jgi:NADH:ubiquinone oxidoreductase subunit 6 (subunit J)